MNFSTINLLKLVLFAGEYYNKDTSTDSWCKGDGFVIFDTNKEERKETIRPWTSGLSFLPFLPYDHHLLTNNRRHKKIKEY